MRLIFMGTPAFALPSLDLLLKSGHTLCAVVTRPDRPQGRGKKLLYSPVKEWALTNTINILQPERLKDKDFLRSIEALNPDLIITAAYGRILPEEMLTMPPLGCINLHASRLPAYRGAAPIHRAVMEGASETGVSIITMVPELDAGDIIVQQSEPIHISDTTGSLHDRLAARGARLMLQAVEALAGGSASFMPQDPQAVTFTAPLQPGEEKLNWSLSTAALHNQIRGMNPWPGAYTTFSGKRLKVWCSEPVSASGVAASKPGTVLAIKDDAMHVAAGDGTLAVLEVQPQGKRAMAAGDFCRGYRIEPGFKLGEQMESSQ